MECYEAYKDSGVEWIGEIPDKWDTKKIKHKCSVKARVGWKGLKASEFLINGYSFLITGTDFKNDKIDWKNCYHIDKDRYDEDPYIQLQSQDLLITKDGTIGKLAVVSELEKPACLNSGIFVVRSLNKDFSTKYLFWVLKSTLFTQFNEYTSYGSTIQHLYQNVFVEFWYPFPGLTEQTAIANYLYRKTAEMDALIAQKQRLIELYQEEKTAIITQAVIQGIDPNAKLKVSGIDWLGEIPENWGVSRLKNICSVRQGLQIPISERVVRQTNDCLPYITIKSINNPGDTKEFIENPSKNVVCSKDDILVARTGATGEIITDVEGVFHNNFFLVDYDRKQVIKSYLINFLKSPKIREYLLLVAGTTTIPDLNHDAFYCTPFFVLTPAEQAAIVNHIETETARIDAKIAKTKRIIELQKEFRTALICEVVTGKIKVSHLAEKEITL